MTAGTVQVRQRRPNPLQRVASAASGALVTLSFQDKMLAGAIARGVAQTILHPIDVVRTRVQAASLSTAWSAGVFVKGVSPQILLALPAGAVQFAAFEGARDWLRGRGAGGGEGATLVAGAVGALAAAVFRVPQEVLKQRIQVGTYRNLGEALRRVLGAEGLPGLYTGAVATISRDVPWNALSFMFHAQAKRAFRRLARRDPKNDENLLLAGVAGAGAAVIMTPVDVVKTRLMTQRADAATRYAGILNTIVTIARTEGRRTLMNGVVPRILYLAPLAGITFSVYEGVVKIMQRQRGAATQAESQDDDPNRALPRPRSSPQPRPIHPLRRRYARRDARKIARAQESAPTLAAFAPSPTMTHFFQLRD